MKALSGEDGDHGRQRVPCVIVARILCVILLRPHLRVSLEIMILRMVSAHFAVVSQVNESRLRPSWYLARCAFKVLK